MAEQYRAVAESGGGVMIGIHRYDCFFDYASAACVGGSLALIIARMLSVYGFSRLSAFYPPDVIMHLLFGILCLAGICAILKRVQEPFATCLICTIVLLPLVVAVCWKLRFSYLIQYAGYTGLTRLDVIEHRHAVSLWSGIITSAVLAIAVTARLVFITSSIRAVIGLTPRSGHIKRRVLPWV